MHAQSKGSYKWIEIYLSKMRKRDIFALVKCKVVFFIANYLR